MQRESVRFSSSPASDIPIDAMNIQDDHYALNKATRQCKGTFMVDNPIKETPSSSQEEELIFFRSVIFSPDVPIRLDYHGKSVNMDQVLKLSTLSNLCC